jgi:transposase
VNKLSKNTPAPAGVDVSQHTLDVAVRDHYGNERTAQFDNTATGHRQVIRWLTKGGKAAHVVLEATGVYSLDLALALHAAKRLEVMVVNPRAARKFAEACLQRSSTDATMAVALREYAARMEFVPLVPPTESARDLRAIARRIATLTDERTSEQNRAHAAAASAATAAVVVNDIAVNVRHLQRRLAELHRQALALIENDPDLTRDSSGRSSGALDMRESISFFRAFTPAHGVSASLGGQPRARVAWLNGTLLRRYTRCRVSVAAESGGAEDRCGSGRPFAPWGAGERLRPVI